ncbi:DEAD/DEAH box helicase [Blastomyces dermatitidis ER-3]|uniref:DEAD/DEAH box helicase n=1 Tax=Ajellomyces dermatitidis (strain ER-3 / ATCC MYA-2586) TaxID=559297 RepID=A0ABM9YIS9_AJEDR|nr:DEAD/DEAH box helicase [Blastomyces dermatitidis ER-3]EEQ92202.1 DEAD/DEAH box helicase [Blastomyces dermatitidis ER-3]EQL36396.1 DEAD/DEAH box helicase domain-containing protein [Blastomyces dermatitidis ATCC 26199]
MNPSTSLPVEVTTTTILPTKAHDGGRSMTTLEPTAGKRKRSTTSSSRSSSASSRGRSKKSLTTSSPSIPWPEPFKLLAQTHRALNLVYTFCSARKHFATTFDNIKTAVEAQTGGRKLSVEDAARVKVLIPRSVRLEIVDKGVVDLVGVKEAKSTRLGKTWSDWEAEGMGQDAGESEDPNPDGESDALIFEFVDGDLKKDAQQNISRRRSKADDIRVPVYSQKHMMSLIEKRNKKFVDAVDAFLAKCQEEDIDPVEKLEADKEMYVPVSPRSGVSTPAAARFPAQIPKERPTIAEIIASIREMEWYHDQIVPDGHRVFDPQPAVYGDLNFPLSQSLVNALYNTRGITKFYSHQAEAINNLHDGKNVIISTSTSSGKSLIYQVPMLHELEQDPHSRGMYIFPTKALAQDQRRSLKELLGYIEGLEHILVETFDGDTPMADRNTIRDEARIIFTNPDMLHITILPQESFWRTFLKNLKFVVVDELHVYNGLFGSHVAFIMRRLRRICAAVGNRRVKFISCSATVANPVEHMQTIFGIDDVKLTDIDGSPSGRKEFICWNTPFRDPGDPSSGRGNSIQESARLFCQLVLRGVRVIAFCRVRKQCELLLSAVRDEFKSLDRINVSRFVMGYRGGYSPQDRRKIERDMFEGKLLGIVATNALELGVDIGSLDAVITHGFPYSISNLRQQSGRAGRRNKDSVSILVGDSYATDQYYMQNPDELFTKPNCELQVDLRNELVLEGHVQCAAFEMPIRPEEDTEYFGPQLYEFASARLTKDNLGFYHCHERFRPHPSKCVAIRDTEDNHYAIIDTTNNRNAVIEEIEESRVFFSIYEGGIFFHQGNPYMVKELNTDRRFARVVRVHVDWTTQQRDFTDIDPVETEAIRRISASANTKAFFGAIRIRTVVYGYFKLDKKGRILDAVALDNPPIEIMSKGMWLDVPKGALDILKSRNLNAAAAIHAAEHAILSLMPTYIVSSSPGDVRTECKVAAKELGPKHRQALAHHDHAQSHAVPPPPKPARQRPARLTFYDAKGGPSGSGIAAKAFEFVDSLLRRALGRIEACQCTAPQGCIECVCDERCKEMNVVMSKAGAGVVLKCLLGMEVDVDALPWGEDVLGEGFVGRDEMLSPRGKELAGGLETIVEAVEVSARPGVSVRIYGAEGE